MNNVIIIGNLSRDVDIRYSDSQMAIASLSVAVNRGKDREGKDRGADFPRVTVFGKQAENCSKFLSKGSKVAVQGRITTGDYTNKDGAKVYTTEITADRVEFLSSKPNGDNSQGGFDDAPSGFSQIDDGDPF